ncbi:MAG: hypothetical protein ACE37F_08905 [Nannocystaceae bacterium]|nr:hypothetical protein [bacterium]
MKAQTTLRMLCFTLAGALCVSVAACDDKKDDAKAEKKGDEKKDKAEDEPGLMLSNDTEVCRKALKCCVESVKISNDGKADPEKVNLSCSGVGMAPDDATCTQFAEGYKAVFEAGGKPVPDVCE